ncbi:lipase, partial [Streptomyces sp. ICN988]|nr:lipase [Streptomyces sp. ICN988]
MKVTTAALPLLPLFQRLLPDLPGLPGLPGLPAIPGLPSIPGLSDVAALPGRLTGLSLTFLKASALEAAILAGHLLLYPSGIIQERRPARALRPTDAHSPQPSPPAPRLPAPASPPV